MSTINCLNSQQKNTKAIAIKRNWGIVKKADEVHGNFLFYTLNLNEQTNLLNVGSVSWTLLGAFAFIKGASREIVLTSTNAYSLTILKKRKNQFLTKEEPWSHFGKCTAQM